MQNNKHQETMEENNASTNTLSITNAANYQTQVKNTIEKKQIIFDDIKKYCSTISSKPVTINYVETTKENIEHFGHFLDKSEIEKYDLSEVEEGKYFTLKEGEKILFGSMGNYKIILGEKGPYPIKNSIFENTYDISKDKKGEATKKLITKYCIILKHFDTLQQQQIKNFFGTMLPTSEGNQKYQDVIMFSINKEGNLEDIYPLDEKIFEKRWNVISPKS